MRSKLQRHPERVLQPVVTAKPSPNGPISNQAGEKKTRPKLTVTHEPVRVIRILSIQTHTKQNMARHRILQPR